MTLPDAALYKKLMSSFTKELTVKKREGPKQD